MIGDQPTGTIVGAQISSVIWQGLAVTVNGKPAKLAIVTDDGEIYAVGDQVATEAEAVAINAYRNFLKAEGHLKVLSKPIISAGKP